MKISARAGKFAERKFAKLIQTHFPITLRRGERRRAKPESCNKSDSISASRSESVVRARVNRTHGFLSTSSLGGNRKSFKRLSSRFDEIRICQHFSSFSLAMINLPLIEVLCRGIESAQVLR